MSPSCAAAVRLGSDEASCGAMSPRLPPRGSVLTASIVAHLEEAAQQRIERGGNVGQISPTSERQVISLKARSAFRNRSHPGNRVERKPSHCSAQS